MGERYLLPAAWGGLEVEVVAGPRTEIVDGVRLTRVGCRLADSEADTSLMWAEPSALTPVKPPLSPEPPFDAVVLAGDPQRLFWHRHPGNDAGWLVAPEDQRCYWSWAQIRELGSVRRLVPDPFAETVKLPWVSASASGSSIGVNRRIGGGVILDTALADFWFSDEKAREIARALWAASQPDTTAREE